MSPEESGSQRGNESWLGNTNHQADSDQGYDGYVAEQSEQPGGNDADVVLDVPVLKIDEIDLEVDDLRLHVSLRAELADLVKVNAGIDAYLDKVKLSVKGVEAQAVLRISLQRVLDTLDRALEAVNRNPWILTGTARSMEQSAEQISQVAEATAGQAGEATERAVDEPGNVTETVSDGSKPVEGKEETGIAEEELVEEGGGSNESAPEGTEDRESESGENGEVDATDMARRKARELEVKLSGIRGTGSGGRILVKDVQRAAKRPAGST